MEEVDIYLSDNRAAAQNPVTGVLLKDIPVSYKKQIQESIKRA
ncbi:hypothetical protein [Butyrivibrio sp. MB2005]|nr:hypothetical protein [Butyrivibrio sp. MB2005]